MTDTTTAGATSRLHAGALALAQWDREANEDGMRGDDIRPEHWTGAEEVWDAVTPKLDTLEALLNLEAGSVVYVADRTGVTLYRRLGTMRGEFRPLVYSNDATEGGGAVRARHLLIRHGSLRLLWAPQ